MGTKISQLSEKERHLDATDTMFFLRELEHVKAQIIDVVYTPLQARTLIPVSFEADPGDEYVTWRQYDKTGLAKVVQDYASDFPRVDVKGAEERARVRSLGASYGYSIQEIRASQKTGKALDARRAMTARESILRLEDQLAWFGDPVNNINGFLTNANISSVIIPNGSVSGSTLWSGKLPDEIVADMNLVANSIVNNTHGVEQPDTMLMGISSYNIAATVRLPNTAITALSFFLQTNPYIQTVVPVYELEGADPAGSGKNMLMAYRRDPLKLTSEIPQDYEQFEPELERMDYEVTCHSRYGGVIIYKPASICYGVGV